MKKLFILLLLLPLSLPAAAAYDLSDMEAPLAGVLACRMNGLPYPQDEVDPGYALEYLFYMANIFCAEDGEPAGEDAPWEAYVLVDLEEADLWLSWAFGDRFTSDALLPDGEKLLACEEGWRIGLADGYPLSVSLLEAEGSLTDQPFEYRFEASDGTVRTGQLLASFRETGDPEAPLALTALSMDEDPDSLMGNWTGDNGYWFSLMEEGLVFLFDGDSALLGQGSYTLEKGILTLDLDNLQCSGPITGGQVPLTLDGVEVLFTLAP